MTYTLSVLQSIARSAQNALEEYERQIALLREGLASNLENTHTIRFTHKVLGRLHDSELRTELYISASEYSDGVKGADLPSLVREFLHREGYDTAVETKLLPRPRTVLVADNSNPNEEEIPY